MGQGSGNDIFALSYYDRGQLGFIHQAASTYTLYDRYFCSLLGPTFPNRYYKWAATSAGKTSNIEQVDVDQGGNQFETIFDRALGRGLSARYYHSDIPFAAVYGPRGLGWSNPVSRYYADCAAGTLPNITIIDPPFGDGGGGDGLSADEHPLGDVRLGQAFMADVVNAFVASPNYRRGALFIVYDEWGGFFDHVRPPRVPDKRSTANLDTDFGQMGFRIPAVTVSPYTRRRTKGDQLRVDHGVYGHESILKLISHRFGLGPPDPAPPLRAQHRPQLRLGQPRLQPAVAARPARGGHAALQHGRRRRHRPARRARRRPGRPGGRGATGTATRSTTASRTRSSPSRTR